MHDGPRLAGLLGALCYTAASLVASDYVLAPNVISRAEVAQGYRATRVLARPRESRYNVPYLSRWDDRIMGLKRISALDARGRAVAYEVPAGLSPQQTIAYMRRTGRFESVEPDYIVKLAAEPDDYRFKEQWALLNRMQNGGNAPVAAADIRAPGGWDVIRDAGSIIVAVIDSGIRVSHEDLEANVWKNSGETGMNPDNENRATNQRDDDHDGYPDNVHGINATVSAGAPASGNPQDDSSRGHGTRVAGIIGAAGNNGIGIAGVAWSVQLMALKAFHVERPDDTGSISSSASLSDVITCVNFAREHGARLINASYTQPFFSTFEFEALEKARNAGIIVVAAADNEKRDHHVQPAYPAAYPLDNIVSVSRTDDLDRFDPGNSGCGSGIIELVAPGFGILSCGNADDSTYSVDKGTSFATPHVTGALALAAVQFPTDSYRQLINRLFRSVDRLPQLRDHIATGGRLNLTRLLTSTDKRPFNDDFADRAPLVHVVEPRAPVEEFMCARTSNVGATREAGEPDAPFASARNSLWWKWTAVDSGTFVVTTEGSFYDTVLSVWIGDTLAALQLVAVNDDAPGGLTSRLSFDAVAGREYQIAVDGYNGAAGNTVLALGRVPLNDEFAQAKSVAAGPRTFAVNGHNRLATREAGEPLINETAVGKTVWYKWTADADAPWTVTVTNPNFSACIGVFTGASVNQLTKIGEGVYSLSGPATVSFQVTANTVYYFGVDSIGTATGSFGLLGHRDAALPPQPIGYSMPVNVGPD